MCGYYFRTGYETHLRKLSFQVAVAKRRDLMLLRLLAILKVDLVYNAHAFDDGRKRRESLTVEKGILAQIDEELRCACVRSTRRECHRAANVLSFHGIVSDRILPSARHLRISSESKLNDKIFDGPKYACIVVEAGANQIEKSSGAQRRLVRLDARNKRARSPAFQFQHIESNVRNVIVRHHTTNQQQNYENRRHVVVDRKHG